MKKRGPRARLKKAILYINIRLSGPEEQQYEDKRQISDLMKLVNRGSNYLSVIAHRKRLWSHLGMDNVFRNDVREEMRCSNRLFDMMSLKVYRGYREEITSGRGFLAVRKPLKWLLLSPIYVPQKGLYFKEECSIHLPTLGRRPVRARAIFGRYKARNSGGVVKMTGTSLLSHSFDRGFLLTVEVEVPDGVMYDEDSLGVDNGVLATLFSPAQVIGALKERSAKASAQGKRQKDEVLKMLEVIQAERKSKLKIYGSIEEGIVELEGPKIVRPPGWDEE